MRPLLSSTNKEGKADHHLFYPRDYQIEALTQLDSDINGAVLCFHRRAGKDLLVFNWVVKELIKETKTAFYILPSYTQAKKVIWDGMTYEKKKFLDYIPKNVIDKKNESELKIWFKNGSLLRFHGSDNPDALRGTTFSICVFSEFAFQKTTVWDVVSPIFAANPKEGKVIFISTPGGKNHFYDLFIKAKHHPKWFAQLLRVEDTNAIAQEALEEEKERMSEDLFAQEYHCSFDKGIDGTFYGKCVAELYRTNRITNVPYDPNTEVHTAWDLGRGDANPIIFFQLCGQEIHIIDSYENQGEALPHYAGIIKSKSYNYGNHFAPHDIKVREYTHGYTRFEKASELGINFQILPKLGKEDGINIARGIFPRLWIDEAKNVHFLKCLTNYRKKFNEVYNVYSTSDVEDWAKHFADAFRYMAVSISRAGGRKMTPDETRRLRNENLGIIDRSKDNFFGV